jgi:hypothetical protein
MKEISWEARPGADLRDVNWATSEGREDEAGGECFL